MYKTYLAYSGKMYIYLNYKGKIKEPETENGIR